MVYSKKIKILGFCLIVSVCFFNFYMIVLRLFACISSAVLDPFLGFN